MKKFTSLQTAIDSIYRHNLIAGENILINNDLYEFKGISGYDVDNTYENMFRKIKTLSTEEMYDQFVGKKYLPTSPTSDYEYVEVIKQNKNGTYNVKPFKKNGKSGSAGSAFRHDLERWKEYKI